MRNCLDPNVATGNRIVFTAGLFKLYLRELPEPLFPFPFYDPVAAHLTPLVDLPVARPDQQGDAEPLLPDSVHGAARGQQRYGRRPHPPATLRAILHHSQNVIANESYNKMGKTNMATVIGPNLLRPEVQSDMSVIKGTADINNITYCFFDSYNDIFLPTETTFGVIGIVRILYDYTPQGEHEIACNKGTSSSFSSSSFSSSSSSS